MALSSFQEMHGHSCLKENPNDCIVFSAEWQLATSLLLLADYNVASLLCATHHAVTNIIQQKKIPSKVTVFSSLMDLVEAPFMRYCFLSASLPQAGVGRGAESPREAPIHGVTPRVVAAGSHTLPAAVRAELGLLTQTILRSCSASFPTEPSKRGACNNNSLTCLCHERSWKECARPHDKRGHQAAERIERPHF